MQALQQPPHNPGFWYQAREGLVGAYEPISSAKAWMASFPAETMLMALDGIRPHGITTIVLDQEGLLNALGGLAAEEPMLAAMLDAGIFEPGDDCKRYRRCIPGRSLLKLEVDQGEGQLREQIEVKPGALAHRDQPEAPGRLYLAPQSQADVVWTSQGWGVAQVTVETGCDRGRARQAFATTRRCPVNYRETPGMALGAGSLDACLNCQTP